MVFTNIWPYFYGKYPGFSVRFESETSADLIASTSDILQNDEVTFGGFQDDDGVLWRPGEIWQPFSNNKKLQKKSKNFGGLLGCWVVSYL